MHGQHCYYKEEQTQEKMAQVLAMLWYHICETIWATTNEIQHSKSNHVNEDKLQQLTNKLLWYL